MRSLITAAVAFSLVLAVGPRAFAGCDQSDPTVASQVKTARSNADSECGGCAAATNHGQYVSCVAGKVKAMDSTALPPQCRGAVVRCAARSTCGKPGFVTCCRTRADGRTKCSTKNGDEHCVAPSGGSACVSVGNPSCCDACTDTGCAPPPAS